MLEELVYIFICSIPYLIALKKGAYADKRLAPFIYFCVASIVVETFLIILAKNHIGNHWLINSWLLVEILLLSFVFRNWFSQRWEKTAVLSMQLLFIVIWSIEIISSGITQMKSLTMIAEHFFVFILAGYYLITLVKQTTQFPFKEPTFWMALGLFLFASGSMIIFSTVDLLYSAKKPAWYDDYYSFLSLIFNYISYIAYSIGFLCYTTKKN